MFGLPRMRKKYVVPLLFVVLIVHRFYNKTDPPESEHQKMYKSWKQCMNDNTWFYREDSEETWRNIMIAISNCENAILNIFRVENFSNDDEIKRHIFPIEKSAPQTIVTIGVGYHIKAEKKLLENSGIRDIEFYGADPMVKTNAELYSTIGKFFPFAVGAKPGIFTANYAGSVYSDMMVTTVDPIYFFLNLIGKQFFDAIWIDAEGAEHDFF